MARSRGGGESEHHVVGVIMRVVGTGNLQLALKDLQDVQTHTIEPLVMAPITRFEPLCLADFQSQRIRLVGETTEINETMKISRIILFAKAVSVEYPGR